MDLGVISVRYARALLKSATKQGIEDAVYQDMQALMHCYLEVPVFRSTIDNPMLESAKKEELLVAAVAPRPQRLLSVSSHWC